MTHLPLRWPLLLTGITLLAAALATLLWLGPSSAPAVDDASNGRTGDSGAASNRQEGDPGTASAVGKSEDVPSASAGLPAQTILTASQEVIVADVASAARSLDSAVTAAGGHLTDESTTSGGPCAPEIPVAGGSCSGQASSALTYRVPADQVTRVMDAAAELGRQAWRNRTATDVSTQVADVDARVRSAQSSLDRLNALMAQADNLADVVALESQVAAREAELESLQAQQRVLQDQTALATVTTTFTTTAAQDSNGPAAAIGDGLAALLAALAGALTVLAWLLPFVVFFAALGLPLAWAIRRRRSERTPIPARRSGRGHGRSS